MKKTKNVASIAVFKDGLLLFGRRGDNKKWALPGGHFEEGEHPTQAALRELYEETGLVPNKDVEFIGDGEVPEANVHVFCFKVDVDTDPSAKNDPDEEFDKFKWFSPSNVPKSVLNNLHSKKNITLQKLGIQKDMSKSEGPHWKCTDGLKIPSIENPKRLIWNEAYIDLVKSRFVRPTEDFLECEIDISKVVGYNIVKSESRLRLYKKMATSDELPPVVVRYDDDGFNLLDGNHRQQACLDTGKTITKAIVVFDKSLKKSFINAVLLGTMVIGGAMQPKPTTHSLESGTGIKVWTPEALHEDLFPIAHLESSWGKNLAHEPNTKGEYHTAFGALGFKPSTAHDEYKKSKTLKGKYPGLEDPADFTKAFKADSVFYNTLASQHFARLKNKHGSPEKAAFAWRWGSRACSETPEHNINEDQYVTKYKKLAADTIKKAELEKMAIRDLKPGNPVDGPLGTKYHDYSHLIESPLIRKKYIVKVVEHGGQGDFRKMHAQVVNKKDGQPVGHLFAAPNGKALEIGAARIMDDHQGKGLGKALYLAAFAHAHKNMGLTSVSGDSHSSMAHQVHQSIANEHKLGYEAEQIGTKTGPYDNAYGPYDYKLK